MTRVERASHRGVEGLALEDDHLRCVILPSLGGKMTSLRLKASGRELMWQDPKGPVKFPPYGAPLPEYDIGGFQECFPTINEVFYPEYPWRGVVVPDHGEVWALPWDHEKAEDGLHLWVHSVRFAYRLDKWVTMRGDGHLHLRYQLTSLAPFDFKCLWSAHPALALLPGMKMLLPESTRVRTEFSEHGRLGEMGTLHDWPVTRDAEGQQVDLSTIQGIEACTHDKLNTVGLTEGWCAVHDPETGEYLAHVFSPEEIPYIGVWLIQGVWPPEGEPYLVGGFEPCTGYPGSLDSAMAWGDCMTLPGRGQLEWSMVMHIGIETDQSALIKMLSRAWGGWMMNTRERFHATMNFEPLDRPLYWEFSYWASTLRHWYDEGLPRVFGMPEHLGDDDVVLAEMIGVDWRSPNLDQDVNRALGFDEPIYRIPINNLFSPPFEEEILEDHEEWRKVRDIDGQVVQISKINGSRRHLESPIKTRADYERVKEERLRPDLATRLPKDWPEVREKLRERTFPLLYGGMQGFFNTPRRFLGFERLMMLLYDDPQLVKDIINDAVDLLIALYDPILSDIRGDCGMISEDMCYKSGCFVSPAMFREFMMPAYRKMTGFYRDHGVRTILVDCDGDVTDLIPLLIEGGVTGLFPFEVTGNCDIVEVRRQFPDLQILGGIDKKKVASGKEAVDEELETKVPFVFEGGGFVPFMDHSVPPTVPWENFCYYRRRLAELAVQRVPRCALDVAS